MAHIHDVCEKNNNSQLESKCSSLELYRHLVGELAVSIQCDLEHFSATLLQILQCSMTLNKKMGHKYINPAHI